MIELLDNIVWHALAGTQAALASGPRHARRFAEGYSPLVGFEHAEAPDLAALLPYCRPGERFYCLGWSGPTAAGWRIEAEEMLVKMVHDGSPPPSTGALDARRLGPADVPQAMALAELTHPGPFGPRTIELGEFHGCFDGQRLVAMAGERLHAATLREVSGICTHPDHQGRGLAGQLTALLMQRQLARGQTPFLHVMSANPGARRLYARLGFREWREMVVRVIVAP